MSNVMPMMHRINARNHAKLQARLEKQRLACRCGGTKAGEKMLVCLACFQSAPVAVQRDAYSRVPEVRRTAMRQLLTIAETRRPKGPEGRPHQPFPGGEPTTACNTPQRLKAVPAPAGASSSR